MKKIFIISVLFASSFIAFSQEGGKGQDHQVITTREASYPGGDQEMVVTFYQKMKYTPEAIKNKVEGQALVSFVVKADSSVANIKVLKDLGYGISDGIKETLSTMKFIPAMENGVLVDREIMYNLPIRAH